ncbi:MAG: DUF2752 domain-containing protein [Actinomycetota bacterium]
MERAFRPFTALTLAAGLAVLYVFPPSRYSFYPRCPFYASTHLLCPGCGSTRALHELLHLNLAGAWHYNALFTALLPVALLWFGWKWYRAQQDRTIIDLRLHPAVTSALVVVALLFTVARNTGLAFVI